MTTELRDPEAAMDWLAAGLMLVRLRSPGPATLREVTPWIRAAAAEAPSLAPPGLIADVGTLLTRPGVSMQPSPRGPLAATLRSYEDEVLGRLAIDTHREAAADAVAALPEPLRPAAIALFVEQVLDRVGFSARTAISPGALRALDRMTGEEWLIRGSAALRSDASERLTVSYGALVSCFQRTGHPIEPGDVAILEQLEMLTLRSERLALRQVVDTASALTAGLPRKLRPTRRRSGHISTKLEDDSAYPVGGFSSISTCGSLENLVTSELALMEDGPEIDLFDVRYAEGELLYYTRDETAFVRERRHLVLALNRDLNTQRYRDEGLPAQRLVLTLGLVRAMVAQLVTWLDRQDLSIQISLPKELDAETQILRLALAEWIEAGIVTLTAERPTTQLLEERAGTAPTDVVWLGTPGESPTPIPQVWQSVFAVAAVPRVVGPFGEAYPLPDGAWEAWRAAFSALVADLV